MGNIKQIGTKSNIITTQIDIFAPSIPCENHCRYCLLSWDGKIIGVEPEQGLKYAQKFYSWLKVNRPDLKFMYYFGYSMEHPQLLENLDFLNETNSPTSKLLMFDGMKNRTDEELKYFFSIVKEKGVERIHFTYYGTEVFHDIFAGRKGDYALMERSRLIASESGLQVTVGIPLMKENISQIEEVVNNLAGISIQLFTPHRGGRGISLVNSKVTEKDIKKLPENIQNLLNRNNHRTPKQWRADPPEDSKYRQLQLSLLQNEMEQLENEEFSSIIDRLEKMDDAYYQLVPSFKELLNIYRDDNDSYIYSKKDLYAKYRQRYIQENNICLTEV